MPKVRLADIATKMNVSTVTVSKALSGQSGVSEEKREQICRLAAEMGYTKHIEKEQKEKESYTLGVIVPERFMTEKMSFYWFLYQSIAKKATRRNCFTMLEVVTYEAEEMCSLPRMVSEEKIEGLIILGAFDREYVDALFAHIQVPVVNVDTTIGPENCDCVVSNNMRGAYYVTNYLFEQGHRRIGFVGTALATESINERFLGYVKSLMEHGFFPEAELILDDRNKETGVVDGEIYFQLPENMPTAFFCNCDLSASILIRKLRDHGYRVPEDVSVAGFDNFVTDTKAGIGITTYEINTSAMANRALHILLHKIKNIDYSAGMFILPGRFIERESTMKIGERIPFIRRKESN